MSHYAYISTYMPDKVGACVATVRGGETKPEIDQGSE